MGGYVLRHQEWYGELPREMTEQLETQMAWFLERVQSRRCRWVADVAREMEVGAATVYRLARRGLVYAEQREGVLDGRLRRRWYVDPVEVQAYLALDLAERRAFNRGGTGPSRYRERSRSGGVSREWSGDGDWLPRGRLVGAFEVMGEEA